MENKAAFDWFQKSAKQGDKDAEHAVAFALIEGKGVRQNVEEGLQKLKALAKAGHVHSAALLGAFYFGKENYLKKNFKEAIGYLEIAAEKGYLDAQKLLWRLYLSKKSDIYDSKTGEKWLNAAAEQNDPHSLFYLGCAIEISAEAKQRKDEVIALYTRAADQKHPEALYHLGNIYLEGEGIPKDVAKGKMLIEEAAQRGQRILGEILCL